MELMAVNFAAQQFLVHHQWLAEKNLIYTSYPGIHTSYLNVLMQMRQAILLDNESSSINVDEKK